MRFLSRHEVRRRFEGKTVAVVGSGPSCASNEPGFVDSHDMVCRVNNYKLSAGAGFRCDAHHSFYGKSVRKTVEDLKRDGVTLCLNKCPNAKFMESEWHRANGKLNGVDFRYIYEDRKDWWFCDVYVPTLDAFMAQFNLLGGHVPTTGFAAILDVLGFNPKCVFLTGFDGFASGIHNVDEPWRRNNAEDPIGHRPERELRWLAENLPHLPVTCDHRLSDELKVLP